jgi:hypothetical protein
MSYRKKKNNKAALFFILLVLVGYMFVSLGQGVNSNSDNFERSLSYEKEVLSLPEECTTCGVYVEEEIIYEEPGMYVAMIDEKYTVDITEDLGEDVLGLSVADLLALLVKFSNCEDFHPEQDLSSVMKLCPPRAGTGIFDMSKKGLQSLFFEAISGGSVKVEAITGVELTVVTYPLAFFLGQHLIQNSNREATLESPNYSSVGQVIDEKYTLKTQAPMVAEELEEQLLETLREDYTVSADIGINDGYLDSRVGDSQDREGKYGISNVEDTACLCLEPEVSSSDYNPGSSNRQGYRKYWEQQMPGGDPYEEPPIEGCLELGEDYGINIFGIVPACINISGAVSGFFKGLISKLFGQSQWDKCNAGYVTCNANTIGQQCLSGGKIGTCSDNLTGSPSNQLYVCEVSQGAESAEECEDARSIGIRMTPIFGDPYECEEELCANAYLTNVYKSGLSPFQSARKRIEGATADDSLMYFLGTPCLANVEIGNQIRSVRVTCLWDVSPYLLDYKIQAATKSPNQEGFPSSFRIYWDLVMQAMELASKAYNLN